MRLGRMADERKQIYGKSLPAEVDCFPCANNINLHAQFLAQFTFQGTDRILIRFDFAAREFPMQRKRPPRVAPGGQHAAIMTDNGADNLDRFLHTAETMILLLELATDYKDASNRKSRALSSMPGGMAMLPVTDS